MWHRLASAAVITLSALSSTSVIAQPHYGKTVAKLEVANSECFFFMLTGVGEADPVVANSPWFAISTTQANARELYALLLTARTSGIALDRVVTSGQIVCGHAQVTLIDY